MLRDLAIKTNPELAESIDLVDLGQAANHFASQSAFEDYRSRKAANTIRRQDADLALFAEFIRETGASVGDLAGDPSAWSGISWGLVAAFCVWSLGRGYSVSSVNVRLSTVKTYAKLALKAGSLSAEDYALIKAVEGYRRSESKRIDERRAAQAIDTRIGTKQTVSITVDQAEALKSQPDTPQGRRDALLMALLTDHGLRAGEVSALTVESIDLKAGELRFYRPKVDREACHKLTGDTYRSAALYLDRDAPESGSLWLGSRKSGKLTGEGFSVRGINARVRALGESAGISGLSPHDCRHYAATRLAKRKTLDELCEIFGWSSPAMALRYIERAKVSNPSLE